MKSILLASASLLAFAGVASAEVTFGGSATLGYNDTNNFRITNPDTQDDAGSEDGFFWDGNIAVTLSQELDGGLTAAAEFNFDFADGNLGQDLEAGDFLLSLTSDTAGLYFGKTSFAAETYWSGVGEMAADGFSEADGETVLRGEGMFGGVTAGVSYIYDDQGWEDYDPDLSVNGSTLQTRAGTNDLVQMSFGATATFGQFDLGVAYQEAIDLQYIALFTDADGDTVGEFNGTGDINPHQIFALSAGTSFAGADVSVAYARTDVDQAAGWTAPDEESFGVGVSYPIGPVTLGATYASNSESPDIYELSAQYVQGPLTIEGEYQDDTDDATDEVEFSVDATYEALEGVTILAGFNGGDGNLKENLVDDGALDYYIAAQAALGEGATMTLSFAADEDFSEEDEIGAPEFKDGTTLEIGFTF